MPSTRSTCGEMALICILACWQLGHFASCSSEKHIAGNVAEGNNAKGDEWRCPLPDHQSVRLTPSKSQMGHARWHRLQCSSENRSGDFHLSRNRKYVHVHENKIFYARFTIFPGIHAVHSVEPIAEMVFPPHCSCCHDSQCGFNVGRSYAVLNGLRKVSCSTHKFYLLAAQVCVCRHRPCTFGETNINVKWDFHTS